MTTGISFFLNALQDPTARQGFLDQANGLIGANREPKDVQAIQTANTVSLSLLEYLVKVVGSDQQASVTHRRDGHGFGFPTHDGMLQLHVHFGLPYDDMRDILESDTSLDRMLMERNLYLKSDGTIVIPVEKIALGHHPAGLLPVELGANLRFNPDNPHRLKLEVQGVSAETFLHGTSARGMELSDRLYAQAVGLVEALVKQGAGLFELQEDGLLRVNFPQEQGFLVGGNHKRMELELAFDPDGRYAYTLYVHLLGQLAETGALSLDGNRVTLDLTRLENEIRRTELHPNPISPTLLEEMAAKIQSGKTDQREVYLPLLLTPEQYRHLQEEGLPILRQTQASDPLHERVFYDTSAVDVPIEQPMGGTQTQRRHFAFISAEGYEALEEFFEQAAARDDAKRIDIWGDLKQGGNLLTPEMTAQLQNGGLSDTFDERRRRARSSHVIYDIASSPDQLVRHAKREQAKEAEQQKYEDQLQSIWGRSAERRGYVALGVGVPSEDKRYARALKDLGLFLSEEAQARDGLMQELDVGSTILGAPVARDYFISQAQDSDQLHYFTFCGSELLRQIGPERVQAEFDRLLAEQGLPPTPLLSVNPGAMPELQEVLKEVVGRYCQELGFMPHLQASLSDRLDPIQMKGYIFSAFITRMDNQPLEPGAPNRAPNGDMLPFDRLTVLMKAAMDNGLLDPTDYRFVPSNDNPDRPGLIMLNTTDMPDYLQAIVCLSAAAVQLLEHEDIRLFNRGDAALQQGGNVISGPALLSIVQQQYQSMLHFWSGLQHQLLQTDSLAVPFVNVENLLDASLLTRIMETDSASRQAAIAKMKQVIGTEEREEQVDERRFGGDTGMERMYDALMGMADEVRRKRTEAKVAEAMERLLPAVAEPAAPEPEPVTPEPERQEEPIYALARLSDVAPPVYHGRNGSGGG